jgi:hypothetical protein
MSVQTVEPAAETATGKFQALKQLRDEVWVQLYLGKAELRDEWMRLEPKWGELRGKMEKIEEASFEAGKDVTAAAQLVIEELGEAYEKIRKAI